MAFTLDHRDILENDLVFKFLLILLISWEMSVVDILRFTCEKYLFRMQPGKYFVCYSILREFEGCRHSVINHVEVFDNLNRDVALVVV